MASKTERTSRIYETGKTLSLGDMPLYGAAPIDGVPDGLRSVFKGASDGHRVTAIEANFDTVSVADLSVPQLLHDMEILEQTVTEHPDKFKQLLSNIIDFEEVSE